MNALLRERVMAAVFEARVPWETHIPVVAVRVDTESYDIELVVTLVAQPIEARAEGKFTVVVNRYDIVHVREAKLVQSTTLESLR